MEKKEVSFEEHMEALDKVHDFIERMGGNPYAYDEEEIDAQISKWPLDIQEAWEIAKAFNDSEEIY